MTGSQEGRDGENWENEGEFTQDNDTYEATQLAFDEDEDDRLPWLEGDDDYDGYQGPDTARILGFVLLGLVALAAIVGGIWWATHRTPDPALVADGGVVAAPSEPYKAAPKTPGGRTFEGTGDSSFAVSEGQTRPARLGDSGAAANKPAFSTLEKPDDGAAKPAAASAPAAAASAGGPVVQVGAYSTRSSAEAAWGRLSGQYSALSGVRHQSVEGKADIGAVFRLQAIPGSAGGAGALCSNLKNAGLACQVKN